LLIPALTALWEWNYSVYGRRKLTKAARKAKLDVGRDQVARLMRADGIQGEGRAQKRFTTHPDKIAVRVSCGETSTEPVGRACRCRRQRGHRRLSAGPLPDVGAS
jgi:hypothetical protein